MNKYRWYSLIANIYDWFVVFPYRKIRLKAISQLNIRKGDAVIDLGCGTGLNLKRLSLSVGGDGVVIAVEPCKRMLNQARKKAQRYKLTNVIFIEKNISEYIVSDDFLKYKTYPLKALCVLVVSVIPQWKKDLENLIHALPKGSTLLVMDLYSKNGGGISSFIDAIAQSQVKRKSWIILEEKLSNFIISWHDIPFYFGLKVFIAVGIKNAEPVKSSRTRFAHR
ncbi:MAG: class I SAM-dependent methyltransferase [Mariprofundaceae bacterium]